MIEKKRFAINMLAQMVAFIVNMSINFFLTPYIVNQIGKEAYGFIGLSNNFIGYAQLLTIALNSMAGRFITISIHKNDYSEANKYISTAFYANLIMAIIVAILSIFVIININNLINVPTLLLKDVTLLFSFVFFNFVFGLLTSVLGVGTFAKNRLDYDSVRSIISNFIRIMTIVICYSFFVPNVWYLGLASTFTTIFMFYTSFIFTKKNLPELKITRANVEITKFFELLKSGIWNTLSKLSVILSVGLDLLIANIFINPSAMGSLSIAKMIPAIILTVFASLSSVYSPNLTQAYANGDLESIKTQLLSSVKLFSFFASIPIAILFAYGDIFFHLWIPKEDANLIHILSIFTCFELIFALPQEGLWNIFTVTNKVKVASINLLIMSILIITTVFVTMKVVESEYRIYFLGAITSFYGTLRLLTFLPIYGAKVLNLKKTTFYPPLIRNIFSIVILSSFSLLIKNAYTADNWLKLIGFVIITSITGLCINSYLILQKKDRQNILEIVSTKFLFNKVKI